MKPPRTALSTVAAALAVAALSFASVASAHEKGNNGFGQEKHGAPQDGETPGSDNGQGVPQGGPGAGMAGAVSKQDGTGLR